MSDANKTPAPVEYWALPKDVIQAVLNHLTEHPAAMLYAKVNQSVLIVQTPVQASVQDSNTTKDAAPSAN
jgi:hypothetical protein